MNQFIFRDSKETISLKELYQHPYRLFYFAFIPKKFVSKGSLPPI